MQQEFFAELPLDQIVIVDDVQNAVVSMIRTDVIDGFRMMELAANQTFQAEYVFQQKQLLIEQKWFRVSGVRPSVTIVKCLRLNSNYGGMFALVRTLVSTSLTPDT